MEILPENYYLTAACLVILILWSFYYYVTQNYDYWHKRGVPFKRATFPLGSMMDVYLGQRNIGEAFEQLYNKFKKERFFGVIDGRVPNLVVNDPNLIKQIMIKDFHYFGDRLPLPRSAKVEYIVHHLFNMEGQNWRRMRLILTPTFTSGKMKMMFSLFDKCSDQLLEYMDTNIKNDSVFDVKDVLSRFTMNIIASCAFGLELDSLKEKKSEFHRIANQILKPNIWRMIRRVWYGIIPPFLQFYKPPLVPKEITEFFSKIIRDTLKHRRENSTNRNDFLDLLIKVQQSKYLSEDDCNAQAGDLKNYTEDKTALTVEEIIAQSFVFFIAGFETSSSTATFSLYELARNQSVQENLYLEIKDVLAKHGGKPTYQALQEMKYLEQVINETLRLYPSLPILNRICTEAYKIPDTGLVLPKGSRITIPLFAIHHDPKYYPDPYKFDPERFSMENIKERHPCVFMPFGEGPRMCIGMRFGMMQTKIALVSMIYKYKIDVTAQTNIPVRLSKTAIVTMPEKPLLLQIRERK